MGRRDDGITAMTSYSYDADGEMVSKIDRRRGATRRDYDPIGQLVAVVPENARAEVFRFDVRGNVEEAGDGVSHRVYGAGNRLERKDNTDYVWDDDGQLVERRESTGGAAVRTSTATLATPSGTETHSGSTPTRTTHPLNKRTIGRAVPNIPGTTTGTTSS
jgi:YD repeat-containing protein